MGEPGTPPGTCCVFPSRLVRAVVLCREPPGAALGLSIHPLPGSCSASRGLGFCQALGGVSWQPSPSARVTHKEP